MKITFITWQELDTLIDELARKINYKPDVLIGVSRGGLIPVRLLSDRLNNANVVVIRTEFYTAIGKTAKEPKITQDITIEVKGKTLLVVDDVADTGKSLVLIKKHLLSKGAREVKIATIHYKNHSEIKPDFYVKETNDWTAYPWEREETKKSKI